MPGCGRHAPRTREHVNRLIQAVARLRSAEPGGLLSQSGGSLAVSLAGQGLNFLLAVILARLLGAGGFGAFSLALAWVGVLGVAASLGLNRLLVREVAVQRAQQAWARLAGVIAWARRAALAASLITAVAAAAVFWQLSPVGGEEATAVMLLALLLLPVTSLLNAHQGIIIGLGRTVAGQVPGAVLQPLAFLAFLLGASFWWDVQEPGRAMSLNIAAAAVALIAAAGLMHVSLPGAVRTAERCGPPHGLLASALSLALIGGLTLLNSRLDAIMLGILTDVESVGIYTAAARGAELVSLVVGPVHTVLGPALSRLHTSGARRELQAVAARAARITFVLALPPAVALGVFGRVVLALFGQDFSQGSATLFVLACGHLAFVAMGPALLLLIMTGGERQALTCAAAGTLVNVTGNALLIPRFGIEGAATATAVSLVVWNAVAVRMCRRSLAVNPTIFARA